MTGKPGNSSSPQEAPGGGIFKPLLPLLHRWAKWQLVLLLALLFLVFVVFILPAVASPGGESLPVLDLMLWYTPQQAYDAISQYSPQARQAAVLSHLTVDLIYPLVYGLLLSLLLVMVFRRASLRQQPQLPLLPWRAVIADYLENIGLVVMFLLYPSWFPLLSWITTVFTVLKWIQLGFSLLALLIGILLLVLGKWKSRV